MEWWELWDRISFPNMVFESGGIFLEPSAFYSGCGRVFRGIMLFVFKPTKGKTIGRCDRWELEIWAYWYPVRIIGGQWITEATDDVKDPEMVAVAKGKSCVAVHNRRPTRDSSSPTIIFFMEYALLSDKKGAIQLRYLWVFNKNGLPQTIDIDTAKMGHVTVVHRTSSLHTQLPFLAWGLDTTIWMAYST
jgi:hypothetical protein